MLRSYCYFRISTASSRARTRLVKHSDTSLIMLLYRVCLFHFNNYLKNTSCSRWVVDISHPCRMEAGMMQSE